VNAEPLIAAGLLAGAVLAVRSGSRSDRTQRRARGGHLQAATPGPGSARSAEWIRHERRVRSSSGPWHVVRRRRGGQLVASPTTHSREDAIHEASLWRQSGRSAAIMDGRAPGTMSEEYEFRARELLSTVPARHRAGR